jgi:hypothetical protein
MGSSRLWASFLLGYLLSIAVETPILVLGLSPRHSLRRRLFLGVWLTACTYPVVILVLPFFLHSEAVYVSVAETFAAVAECLLFWLAFGERQSLRTWSAGRDFAVIILANLASFGLGEILYRQLGPIP